MIDLKGKVAVITGSARGIGRAVAEKLAQAGANLVITDILAEIGEKTAKEISEKIWDRSYIRSWKCCF